MYEIFTWPQLRAWRSTLFRFLILVSPLTNPDHFFSTSSNSLLCKYFVVVYGWRTYQTDHFPIEYSWNLSFPSLAWKAKTNSFGDNLLSTTARRSSASFAAVICREREQLGKASKVSRRKIIAFVPNSWARLLKFLWEALKELRVGASFFLSVIWVTRLGTGKQNSCFPCRAHVHVTTGPFKRRALQ